MSGTLLCSLSLFVVSFSNIDWLSKTFIFAFVVGFQFSLGPIVWLVNSEILPDIGISIATFANWVIGAIVVLTFPILSNLHNYKFLIYAGSCCLCLLFLLTKFKETKGLTAAQIADIYAPVEAKLLDNSNLSS